MWLVSSLGLGVEGVIRVRVPVVVVGVVLGEPLAKRVLEFSSVSVCGEVGLLEGCCPGGSVFWSWSYSERPVVGAVSWKGVEGEGLVQEACSISRGQVRDSDCPHPLSAPIQDFQVVSSVSSFDKVIHDVGVTLSLDWEGGVFTFEFHASLGEFFPCL